MTINKIITALALSFSTVASMAMAEDMQRPAHRAPEFRALPNTDCNALVRMDLNPEITLLQEDIRYYASIVGCELYKQQQSQSNNLSDSVKLLQKFINAESEDKIDVDSVLGPDTALALIRLAVANEYYEPFLYINVSSAPLEKLFMERFMNEVERQNSSAYDLATGLAGLHNSETNQLPDSVVPVAPEEWVPSCNRIRSININYDGPCYFDAKFENPTNVSVGTITYSI